MDEELTKEIKIENKEEADSLEDKLAVKRRTLQRSHTIGVGSRPLPNKALLKGLSIPREYTPVVRVMGHGQTE